MWFYWLSPPPCLEQNRDMGTFGSFSCSCSVYEKLGTLEFIFFLVCYTSGGKSLLYPACAPPPAVNTPTEQGSALTVVLIAQRLLCFVVLWPCQLGMEPRAVSILDKWSTTEPTAPGPAFYGLQSPCTCPAASQLPIFIVRGPKFVILVEEGDQGLRNYSTWF